MSYAKILPKESLSLSVSRCSVSGLRAHRACLNRYEPVLRGRTDRYGEDNPDIYLRGYAPQRASLKL